MPYLRRAVEHRQCRAPLPGGHPRPSRAPTASGSTSSNPDKVGHDAGELAGLGGHVRRRPRPATSTALLAPRARLHRRTPPWPTTGSSKPCPDLERFLAAGINVGVLEPGHAAIPGTGRPARRAGHRGGGEGGRLHLRQRGRPGVRQRRAPRSFCPASASASKRFAAPRSSTTTPTTSRWCSSASWALAVPWTRRPSCSLPAS